MSQGGTYWGVPFQTERGKETLDDLANQEALVRGLSWITYRGVRRSEFPSWSWLLVASTGIGLPSRELAVDFCMVFIEDPDGQGVALNPVIEALPSRSGIIPEQGKFLQLTGQVTKFQLRRSKVSPNNVVND